MKTNKEPKVLYLQPDSSHPAGKRYLNLNKVSDNDIEYTRTDAFVDKAVSYLNSKLYDWVQTTNPNQRSYANTIMKQYFIEDFRKYMEGE